MVSEYVRLVILGIVQGLTEFLPVSSSGHLEITKFLLHDDSLGEESLITTVVLHFATALSTVFVFRKDIADLILGLVKPTTTEERHFVWYIILSLIPAALVGIFFEKQIEALFYQQLVLVGISLLVTGLLLFFASKKKAGQKLFTAPNALIVGVAQAVAILPGLSRSGSTIATSLLLGIDKNEATRFSFLMVVPLIFGKIILDILEGDLFIKEVNIYSLGLGFLAAFVAGVFACKLMIKIVQKSQLIYFAYYCFVIGILAIFLAS